MEPTTRIRLIFLALALLAWGADRIWHPSLETKIIAGVVYALWFGIWYVDGSLRPLRERIGVLESKLDAILTKLSERG